MPPLPAVARMACGVVAAALSAAAMATSLAEVEAEHRRQRALCLAHPVAAVRHECLRQANRSRALALASLPASAASRPASGR